VEEAILTALENNQSLKLERLNPQIQRTFVDEQRAAFDPTLAADLSQARARPSCKQFRRSISTSEVTTTPAIFRSTSSFPRDENFRRRECNGQDGDSFTNAFDAVRGGISLTQSLLQGGEQRSILRASAGAARHAFVRVRVARFAQSL